MLLRPKSFLIPWPGLLAFMLASLALSGCTETGPILFVPSQAYTKRVAETCSVLPGSDLAPTVISESTRFKLAPGEKCSALKVGEDWQIGHNYLMGFDVRLDQNRIGPRPVTLARLVRTGASETELASVRLSRKNGITILGRSCVPPADLGGWHTIELRIALSDTDSGFLEVFCDRKPIWAQDKFRTTLPPVCRHSEGCATRVQKPIGFEWQVGLMARQGVARRMMVEMKQIFYRRLFVIPHRIGNM